MYLLKLTPKQNIFRNKIINIYRHSFALHTHMGLISTLVKPSVIGLLWFQFSPGVRNQLWISEKKIRLLTHFINRASETQCCTFVPLTPFLHNSWAVQQRIQEYFMWKNHENSLCCHFKQVSTSGWKKPLRAATDHTSIIQLRSEHDATIKEAK